jgi:hypothetical protein
VVKKNVLLEEMRITNTLFVRKLPGERLLGRTRRRWEVIKTFLKERLFVM